MKKSYVIAIVMTLVIVAWMASGLLTSNEPATKKATEQDKPAFLVETQLQTAKKVQLSLNVQGQVEPLRKTAIRSDLDGKVIDILVAEGTLVEAGEIILKIDPEDRQVKLAKENAMLLSQQQTYARTQTLVKQGLQPKSTLESEFAALKTAEANVAQIKLAISKLNIAAPFDGVINHLEVEKNSFITANSEIADFVDNTKLTVVVAVAQQDILTLSKGLEANVKFATGQQKTGVIQFISPVASESTRTFRVEINVENADRAIPAGISAEVDIPTKEAAGHFVSPAVLALDAAGEIGVKSVDDGDSVVFTPVSIIKSSTKGIWVTGLPSTVNIITTGQGFVEAGAKVDWQASKDEQHTATSQFSQNPKLNSETAPQGAL